MRRASEADRRQVEVHLTPRGDRGVNQLASLHRDELDSLQHLWCSPLASAWRYAEVESMLRPLPNAAKGFELHRAIVEQSADAIIFSDREGIIHLWNGGAEIVFGFSQQEAIGHSLNLIIPERFRRAHDAGYRLAMETGQLRHDGRVLTTRSQHKYGRRLYVDLSFGLLRDPTGNVTGAFAMGRDCTERYLEQQALRAQDAGTA